MATQNDIDRALTIAHTIHNIEQRAETLCVIAKATATHGQQVHALAILNIALTIAHTIDNTKQRDKTLRIIAEATATYDINAALTITHTIDNTEQRDKTLRIIAEATATYDINTALTILQIIGDLFQRAEVFYIILQKAQSVTEILTIVHHGWVRSKVAKELWILSTTINSLIQEYPWLGTAILEEEAWVNDQLKRLG